MEVEEEDDVEDVEEDEEVVTGVQHEGETEGEG